jgi:hypothetical protein
MVACVALAVSLTVAAVQTDFAGRWTTDPDPAAPAPAGPGQGRGGPARGDMGSGWGPTITIAQDTGRLTVEYAFFARGDMQPPLRFAYALDGSATKNTVMMGHGMQTQVSTAKWDGARLVIRTGHSFIDAATGKPATTEVTQTLSLESPSSLVVETTRAGVNGGPPSTTRTTYRKL